MSAIQTPCVQVCFIDTKSELCQGCGRSRVEIADWTKYSDMQRSKIMASLPARLVQLRNENKR